MSSISHMVEALQAYAERGKLGVGGVPSPQPRMASTEAQGAGIEDKMRTALPARSDTAPAGKSS